MTHLVVDSPRPVVSRGWRRGLPIGVLHLLATAVVHARLLPATTRSGDAGDQALERWLVAVATTAALTTVVWLALCVRIEVGANRWVPPPRRSGVPPVPDPSTGCLPVLLAIVALALATLVEVIAVDGPRDAVWLAALVLLVQLAAAVATSFVLLSVVMPVVLVVTGMRRTGAAEGGGGPTGPALIASGVASYAALTLATLPLLASALDVAVGWRTAALVAAVLVGAWFARVALVRRARPD